MMALTGENQSNPFPGVRIKSEFIIEAKEESLTSQIDIEDVDFNAENIKPERESNEDNASCTSQWLAGTTPALRSQDELETFQLQNVRGIVVSGPNAVFDAEKLSNSVERFIKKELKAEQESSMFLFVDCNLEDPLAQGEKGSCNYNTLTEPHKTERPIKSNEETYLDKRIQCNVCSVTFRFFADLDAHMTSHDLKKLYSCRFCPVVLPTIDAWSRHEAAHPENNLRKCRHCFCLIDKRHFDAHMLMHVGGKQFTCQFCSSKYLTNWQLERHLKSHSMKEPIPIRPNLGASLCQPGRLRDENKSVTSVRKSERLYVCCFCQSKLLGLLAVNQHEGLIHPGKKLKACLYCCATFPSTKELKAHTVIVHASERPFACPLCPNRYPTKGELNRHSRSHSDHRPYSCSYCSRSFRQPNSLKDHLSQHLGEKRFCCAHCPAKFFKKKSLELHVGIHSYKEFSKERLEEDIRVKPFFCTICFARFQCINSQRRHMRKGSCNKPQSIRNVRPLLTSESQS